MPEWTPTSCAMALKDFPGLDEIIKERVAKPKSRQNQRGVNEK
jgi:hypothetical protein